MFLSLRVIVFRVIIYVAVFAVSASETVEDSTWVRLLIQTSHFTCAELKVARYSLSGSIPPKFERKLRRHKQRLGKINTTVVLDKDENLL